MNMDNHICLTEELRLLETLAEKRLNLTSEVLMQRAAQAIFHAVERFFPRAKRLIVVCGSGNNAGDGYVFAKIAQAAGLDVAIYPVSPIESLDEPVRHIALKSISEGIPILNAEDFTLFRCDLIIDALLGIGIDGHVRDPMYSVIEEINAQSVPVLAVDIPSGLHADSGMIQGVCIKANLTVSMMANKLGFYMNSGPDNTGRIITNHLGLIDLLEDVITDSAMIKTIPHQIALPRRPKNCHKGDFGYVGIIGGNFGMPGAPALAAIAALRTGAGRVSIITRDLYSYSIVAQYPEIMVHGIEDVVELEKFTNLDVIIAGPGFGDDAWAQSMLQGAIELNKPMIIDAQALRLLAYENYKCDNWILTPHPGEAASLLDTTVDDILEDRFNAINKIQHQYGGVVVLKGVGSLVADRDQVYIANAGNPAMATAGMGDALSGIIAGLLGQGLSLLEAAKLGVMLHARSADYLASISKERGAIVTDIWPYLQALVNHA